MKAPTGSYSSVPVPSVSINSTPNGTDRLGMLAGPGRSIFRCHSAPLAMLPCGVGLGGRIRS